MPAKQIRAGVRVDPETEARAWRMTFKSGFDFLRSLPKIGVEVSCRHQPAREVAAFAWRRLGERYLAGHDFDGLECWAEREFGDPSKPAARRRAGVLKV